MTRLKRIFTALLVVILACGLLIGTCVTVSAKDITTTTIDISRDSSFLLYKKTTTSSYGKATPNSSGWCEFSSTDVANWNCVVGFEQHVDVFSDYGIDGILDINVAFYLTCIDSNLEYGFDGVFNAVDPYFYLNDISLHDYIIDKQYTLYPNEHGYQGDLRFSVDLSKISFDDISRVRLDVAPNNLLHWNGTECYMNFYLDNASVTFTYIYKTAEDESNEKLDDVNSNLGDIKDAIVGTDIDDGGAVSGLDDIKNNISIDIPENLPVDNQIDSLGAFVKIAGTETTNFFNCFVQPIPVKIMGYEFDLFTLFFGFLGLLLLFGLVFLIVKGSHGTGSNKDD